MPFNVLDLNILNSAFSFCHFHALIFNSYTILLFMLLIIRYIVLQDIADELELRSKKYLRGEAANLKVLN